MLEIYGIQTQEKGNQFFFSNEVKLKIDNKHDKLSIISVKFFCEVISIKHVAISKQILTLFWPRVSITYTKNFKKRSSQFTQPKK